MKLYFRKLPKKHGHRESRSVKVVGTCSHYEAWVHVKKSGTGLWTCDKALGL